MLESMTAVEVLEDWREACLSDQENPGYGSRQYVYEDADLVLQLAKAEEVSLEELIPDESTRHLLEEHARIYDLQLNQK